MVSCTANFVHNKLFLNNLGLNLFFKMSHGLVPSRSTVYISNLPFDLKNNDLHKIFEKHGRIIKVTVLKDKQLRRSKGVAFILFFNKEDAKKCADATNQQEMFGRTLKASIAKDNGRSAEFIRRKNYLDKSQCYECGEVGHLSYNCSKNLLGNREPPPKKVRKRKKKSAESGEDGEELDYYSSDEDRYDETKKNEEEDIPDDETLSAAIALEQEKQELERYRLKVATGNYSDEDTEGNSGRKKIKKSAYFSDEEEVE